MERQTNFLIMIGEWWEARKSSRRLAATAPRLERGRRWLPTPGNAIFTVVFTLLVITTLLWAQSAGALTLNAPAAASTGVVAYQGRLANTGGAPLTGVYNMIFRLYAATSGGSPLWEEQWTGSNSVQVSDGLFNVMLGSLTPIPQAVVTANPNLFLGITVGTDGEMSPRVQLGSVPFAVQALTVPDGSITKTKLAADVTLQPIRLQVLKSDGISISASDWVNMTGMSVTHTFAQGTVKAQFCAPMTLSQANSTGGVRIVVDGVSQTSTKFSVSASFIGWHDQVVCLNALANVTSGEHTIAVQWYTNSTQLTAAADRVLIVEQ